MTSELNKLRDQNGFPPDDNEEKRKIVFSIGVKRHVLNNLVAQGIFIHIDWLELAGEMDDADMLHAAEAVRKRADHYKREFGE